MLFVGVFLLLSALPSGWLSDRYGKKPVIVLSSVLAAAGMFVVMLVPDVAERVPSAQPVGAPIAIYVGGCMIGAAIGLFYPANWALGTQVVPRDQAGRYLGLSNLASAGAGAIGGYIGGPIADHLGYTLLFIIYGMLFLLSALALKGIQEQVTPAHLFRGWRPA
jgi:MFS family permease